MDLFAKLNPKQIEAVKEINGPVIVIAGAGSGKTRVLTHRLANIVSQGVDSKNILAVTFTNKAAKEMQERVELLLGSENNSTIMTFHSLCARILRVEGEALGYKRNFEIYDDDEVTKVLKKVFEDLKFNNTNYKIKDFKSKISLIKNGKTLSLYDSRLEADIKLCYEKYNERLKLENAMDFDDLLLRTVDLFNLYPNILEYYQRKFLYIMVDEFQDTNTIQYDLICLLASRYKNIFVVGDGDQSIYSFRNANVGNIKEFIRDFNPKRIILDTNYRSTQYILDAANSIINHNSDRIKKDLIAFKDKGYKPVLKECFTMNDELLYIKNKIIDLHSQGYSYDEMAVFYRMNALSRNIEETLMKNNIPYKIYGGVSFFSRKEIKDIIAYLKLVLDRENLWAFKRVVNEPKRGIGTQTIDKIESFVDEGYLLNEAINKVGNKKVFEFYKLIDEIEKEFMDSSMKDYIDILVDKLNYKEIYKDEIERLGNIYEFKSVLNEADETYEGTNFEKLNEMLLYLSLKTDKTEDSSNENGVSLMTYHQAKGLEYKVVFMMALEEGIFPSTQSFFLDQADLEEERRIAYVGVTRAMERLYLTHASSRMLYGEQKKMGLSRFVREINPKYIENEDETKRNLIFKPHEKITITPKKVEEKPKYVDISEYSSDIDYDIGDKVNHKIFGDGIVVNVEGEKLVIAFKQEVGIKKIAKGHPTLSKL